MALAVALLFSRAAVAEAGTPAAGAGTTARDARRPIEVSIELEREPGAEACPDTAAIFRSLALQLPEQTFAPSSDTATSNATVRVVIRAVPAGYEAALSMLSPHPGERTIPDGSPGCRGLADALALAIGLLVDPDLTPPAPQPAPPPPPPITEPTAATLPKQKPERSPLGPAEPPDLSSPAAPGSSRKSRSFAADLAASGVGGLGLVSKPAGGATLGVELFHQSGWGISAGGMRLWSPPNDAQGGSVTLTVWAFFGGPCYKLRLNTSSSVDACLRLGAGSQHATVEGFISPHSRSFPWMVLAPTLGYRLGLPGALSGFVRVGPVGQLRSQSFSAGVVDEANQTVPIARAPSGGVMAELGILAGEVGF